MEAQPTTPITEVLAELLASGADVEEISSSVALAWGEIEVSLSPVIGAAGVAALCKRSIHLASREHPFLAAHAGQAGIWDPDALHRALAAQTREDAAAAGADILKQFRDLLARLVGPDLTERLLRTAWNLFSMGTPNLDASS